MSEFRDKADKIVRNYEKRRSDSRYGEDEALEILRDDILRALNKTEEIGFDRGVSDMQSNENVMRNVNEAEIIVLCGSTRFHAIFDQMNYEFTMQGKIVLSIGTVTSSDLSLGITREQKHMLDELHKRKIDLADTVYVINYENYIGESTRAEIEYARKLGKPIRFFHDEMMQSMADDVLDEWNDEVRWTQDLYGGDF